MGPQLIMYRYVLFAILFIIFLAVFAAILFSKVQHKRDKIIVTFAAYILMLMIAAMATAEYCC